VPETRNVCIGGKVERGEGGMCEVYVAAKREAKEGGRGEVVCAWGRGSINNGPHLRPLLLGDRSSSSKSPAPRTPDKKQRRGGHGGRGKPAVHPMQHDFLMRNSHRRNEACGSFPHDPTTSIHIHTHYHVRGTYPTTPIPTSTSTDHTDPHPHPLPHVLRARTYPGPRPAPPRPGSPAAAASP